MTRTIPVLLSLAILLYAFFDVVKQPDDQIRRLPKWGWIIIIFIFSGLGGLLYLWLGRPKKNGGGKGPRRGKPRIIPPDDDPDFLKKL